MAVRSGTRFAHNRLVLSDQGALDSIHEVLTRTGFALTLRPQGGESVWSTRDTTPATAHTLENLTDFTVACRPSMSLDGRTGRPAGGL